MMPRGRLQQGLDRDIYQVVQKYLDSQKDPNPARAKPYAIYDWLRTSNSSLKRRPKKQLEDSIERVLAIIQEDDAESSGPAPIERNFEVEDESSAANTSMDIMNQSIVSSWAGTRSNAAFSLANGKKRDVSGGNVEGERKKRKRQEKPTINTAAPGQFSLKDMGGVGPVLKQLKEHLVLPLLQPEEYTKAKIPIPRGILLHGPPGCGKTSMCRAFASALGVPFIEILGPSVVSGISGESEKQIREHFEKAKEAAPCLIFIDEIDVIAPKRDTAQSQMDKRMVAQLLISMDGLAMEGNDGKPVIVLAATNRPDSLDPALRRGGRFDTEINMGVPNEANRQLILKALTREPVLAPDVNFSVLAKRTAGFVGADLRDLVSKAGTWSMDQYRQSLEDQAAQLEGDMDIDSESVTQEPTTDVDVQSVLRLIKRAKNTSLARPAGFEVVAINMAAFEAVLPTITPSSKREGFATVPDVTWSDIGALKAVRKQLQAAIVEPIQNPQRYRDFGITAPAGVLLWGPPGCGKTLLAKAAAAESKANFISVNGPELLNKYVGESERAVRQVFSRARSSIPCVIFFDEMDALAPHRSNEVSEATSRVVNTLLSELDGLNDRNGIYVIAATNFPDMIDSAMLRPGRLEIPLYVPLPSPEARVSILRTVLSKMPIDPNLASFARADKCKNFSGADLTRLVRNAAQQALDRRSAAVEEEDFVMAAKEIPPSVGDMTRYEKLRERYETRLRVMDD